MQLRVQNFFCIRFKVSFSSIMFLFCILLASASVSLHAVFGRTSTSIGYEKSPLLLGKSNTLAPTSKTTTTRAENVTQPEIYLRFRSSRHLICPFNVYPVYVWIQCFRVCLFKGFPFYQYHGAFYSLRCFCCRSSLLFG